MATIKSKVTAKTTSVNTGTAAKPKLPTTGGLSTVKKTATKATGATQAKKTATAEGATPVKKEQSTATQPIVQKPAEYQAPQFKQNYKAPTYNGTVYTPGSFDGSQYQGQIDQGMNNLLNREDFNYDPMKDANYQALAELYSQQGNKAAKDTMADAAALNGGYGSSFAQTAAQQVRNDYNQQLAAMIPELEQNAYNKYLQSYNMDKDALNMLQAADESAYARHRDSESDKKWQYEQEYGQHRDNVADAQWQYGMDYQKYRDSVADDQWKYGQDYQAYRDSIGDQQWQTEYDRGAFESDRNYNYQVDRDKVADDQWQAGMDYQKGRDQVADQQWTKEFNYQKTQDKTANEQWKQEFIYMQDRDKVADDQWAKEYALAKKDSGTSKSGDSSAPTYTATGNTGLDASSIWKRASNK